MAYPSVISTLPDPLATDRLNNPSHSGLHRDTNAAIEEVQTFVGTLSSTQGTLSYDIRSPLSNGGGHVQTADKGGTGQTTYNKGDLLVGQSSSVLTKLAVGNNDQVIVADSTAATGVRWGAAPTTNVQSFLSTGVWTKPTAANTNSRIFVQIWGGGGSGGSAPDANGEAGGGGGGAYNEGWFSASVLQASVLVQIGAGGASVVSTNGVDGSRTVFGSTSMLTAFGGGGGSGNNTAGGGGGGGGIFSGGVGTTNATGGAGGSFGDAAGVSSIFASGGGANNQRSQNAQNSSGGGGAAAPAGSVLYGGAGGGGVSQNGVGGGGFSGTGSHGGNAGSSVAGQQGTRPAGGGGGAWGATVASGKGGDGMAVITTFF